ncbi:MAG: septum formation initiator family protein [Oligoflexia bacterium]|nr:septum formation initiator family protein [Oligoflexia bacterium]
MKPIYFFLREFLEHPLKVGIAAIAIALASLITEGSLFNLWNLSVERQRLIAKHQFVTKKNQELNNKILKATNSDNFIGHEARERLDLVSEDELVFIFDN